MVFTEKPHGVISRLVKPISETDAYLPEICPLLFRKQMPELNQHPQKLHNPEVRTVTSSADKFHILFTAAPVLLIQILSAGQMRNILLKALRCAADNKIQRRFFTFLHSVRCNTVLQAFRKYLRSKGCAQGNPFHLAADCKFIVTNRKLICISPYHFTAPGLHLLSLFYVSGLHLNHRVLLKRIIRTNRNPALFISQPIQIHGGKTSMYRLYGTDIRRYGKEKFQLLFRQVLDSKVKNDIAFSVIAAANHDFVRSRPQKKLCFLPGFYIGFIWEKRSFLSALNPYLHPAAGGQLHPPCTVRPAVHIHSRIKTNVMGEAPEIGKIHFFRLKGVIQPVHSYVFRIAALFKIAPFQKFILRR